MSKWVKIVSWHILSGVESRGGQMKTLCGRWVDALSPVVDEFPYDEKSCEVCLRIKAMDDGL